ncbi:transcription factor mtf-1 [Stylonychia lemnae]|uniref:Transcription factor mtf-1 n=1 Tax=Stylonychia lemnae TaxID=5949 RepID=A0A078B2Y9_STYLE|nr:transcription factor mtf-1 [Stylonychia lemnae]|eukprot:CDW88621.1 transcription factor mtf-1 [Stylonychia lemnae]
MKRPYECNHQECDKKFTTRFSLRRHIATHQPAKQFVCVICFKKFALAQYLKEHTYIHTGQKPFKCPYDGCTKAFRQAGKLSMHKKFHQNKIFIVQKIKKRPVVATNSFKKTLKCENSCSLDSTHEMKVEIPLFKKFIQSSEGSLSTNEDLINSSASHSPRSMTTDFQQENLTFQNILKQQQIQLQEEEQVLRFIDNLQYPSMVMTRMMPVPGSFNQSSFAYPQKIEQQGISNNQLFLQQRLPQAF